jgi:hypothetical protein
MYQKITYADSKIYAPIKSAINEAFPNYGVIVYNWGGLLLSTTGSMKSGINTFIKKEPTIFDVNTFGNAAEGIPSDLNENAEQQKQRNESGGQ